ncbi:endolytic transglycosylase MltG [Pedobacter immunditicola]|uniref:endolytic transglycosylase MltG n=1 Tax=Pedobacter immunditicola TaxID=3133440 RepID=UPI00309C0E25
MINEKRNLKGSVKVIIVVSIVLLMIGLVFGFKFYKIYFAPNVTESGKYLYVKTGGTLDDVFQEIKSRDLLRDTESFSEAAERMDLALNLKPGRYRLLTGMNNRSLVNKIKAGNQEPVDLKFQNIRRKEDFSGYLAKNLEPDSLTFAQLLDSASFIAQHGFTTDNIYTMFIPNTYEMYWNTSALDFFNKMKNEYEKFWNAERKQKAEALKMTPIQVSILASIVDAEAIYNNEMPIIAGLYLNRLDRGILLQADPTVIFANGDFTVKRVTYALLKKDSKYNTYKYAGLPPGPIMMPSIKAIDAVLNKDDNNYLYMCAKEDFSGYHSFAETRQEHEINAKKYRDALNQRKIFR